MEIKCEFKPDTWELYEEENKDPTTVYSAIVSACDITNRDSAVSAFHGAHKRAKKDRDVKGLTFEDTTVHFIPKNLTAIFPDLVYLLINQCGLKEVLAEDLAGLENLEVFWASNNKISILPADLFKNIPKLKEAAFNNNKIEKLDVKILEPIKNTIESFDVLGNPGLSEIFKKGTESIGHFIKRLKNLEFHKMNSKRMKISSQAANTLTSPSNGRIRNTKSTSASLLP